MKADRAKDKAAYAKDKDAYAKDKAAYARDKIAQKRENLTLRGQITTIASAFVTLSAETEQFNSIREDAENHRKLTTQGELMGLIGAHLFERTVERYNVQHARAQKGGRPTRGVEGLKDSWNSFDSNNDQGAYDNDTCRLNYETMAKLLPFYRSMVAPRNVQNHSLTVYLSTIVMQNIHADLNSFLDCACNDPIISGCTDGTFASLGLPANASPLFTEEEKRQVRDAFPDSLGSLHPVYHMLKNDDQARPGTFRTAPRLDHVFQPTTTTRHEPVDELALAQEILEEGLENLPPTTPVMKPSQRGFDSCPARIQRCVLAPVNDN